MMTNFKEIQSLLESTKDPKKVEALRFSSLIEDNELAQATYALYVKQLSLKPYKPKFFLLPCGAVALFHKGFFPWEGLPYPQQHAELGTLLAQLEDEEMNTLVQGMKRFQEATLDHYKKPVLSLFQQEGRATSEVLFEANRVFFDTLHFTPSNSLHFADSTLCMISKRSETATVICAGSGCKSGMGVFLSQDAGVVNFGPQLLPLGCCSAFGLAGRAQKAHLHEEKECFSLSYRCRLASPSERSIFNLQDSGYSGFWMHADVKGNLQEISLHSHFEGFSPLNKIVFSFFGKAEACFVAGSHKLTPKSLDRYTGPAQTLSFSGKLGGVSIEATEGASKMEIIPLAGDESFWGADFLAVYTLADPTIAFSLKNF